MGAIEAERTRANVGIVFVITGATVLAWVRQAFVEVFLTVLAWKWMEIFLIKIFVFLIKCGFDGRNHCEY